MKLLKFEKQIDRVSAESELLEKLHQAIGEYAGIITVVQAIGILEVCKKEIYEENE